MRYHSRYDYGKTTVLHKGKKITTSLGSEYDDLLEDIENSFEYEIGKIPYYHDSRPDLTSYIFYDSPRYWWLLLHANALEDSFNFYDKGDLIRIPKL
jgi:hypothetical protein